MEFKAPDSTPDYEVLNVVGRSGNKDSSKDDTSETDSEHDSGLKLVVKDEVKNLLDREIIQRAIKEFEEKQNKKKNRKKKNHGKRRHPTMPPPPNDAVKNLMGVDKKTLLTTFPGQKS